MSIKYQINVALTNSVCLDTTPFFFFKIPCWVRIRQDTLTKRPKIPLIFPDVFCCISASKTLPLLEYKYDFNNWLLLVSFKNTELLYVYFIFITTIIVNRILSDAKTYEYIQVFMIAINQSWKAKLLTLGKQIITICFQTLGTKHTHKKQCVTNNWFLFLRLQEKSFMCHFSLFSFKLKSYPLLIFQIQVFKSQKKWRPMFLTTITSL